MSFFLLVAFALSGMSFVQPSAANGPPSAAPSPSSQPTKSQREAYETGRAYERVVLALQQPTMLAISALAPRFDADISAIESESEGRPLTAQARKAYEGVRSYLHTGVVDPAAGGLVGSSYYEPFINGGEPKDAGRWWFVEAGLAEVELRAAKSDVMMQMTGMLHTGWITRHTDDAGALSSLLPLSALHGHELPTLQKLGDLKPGSDSKTNVPSSASGSEIEDYDSKLLGNLEGAFVEPPYPVITYPNSLVGDARLGVAWTTAGQMAQFPDLLSQADSQSFLDDFFRALAVVLPDAKSRDALTKARGVLQYGTTPSRDDVVNVLFSQIAKRMYATLPKERTNAIFLGADAVQAPWTAIVVEDQDELAFDLHFVGSVAELDPLIPGFGALRERLAAVKSSDASSTKSAADAVVAAILSP